jgi:hypothetical protein
MTTTRQDPHSMALRRDLTRSERGSSTAGNAGQTSTISVSSRARGTHCRAGGTGLERGSAQDPQLPQSAVVNEINSAVTPRVARPPHEWEWQTLALIVAAGCAALLGMLLLVSDLAVRSYLITDGVNGLSPLVGWILDNGEVISGLYLVLGFGYLVGYFLWRRRTVAMLDSIGQSDPGVVWHWTVAGWYFALAASFMIRFANNPAGPDPASTFSSTTYAGSVVDTAGEQRLAAWLAWDAAQIGVRLIGLTFLLLAVWQIRTQVRERVATSGVVLRIGDMPSRRSALPVAKATRPTPPVSQPADLAAADEEFWHRVGALASGRRAEIAVLETVDARAHRWLLVPESGDVSAVRAAVAPGAVVTAFPEPPAATETKGYTPGPADEYHGFLECTRRSSPAESAPS